MDNFVLLHLKANNSAVCINLDTISVIIKDTPMKSDEECTCVYLKEECSVKRIFVNESIERAYRLIRESKLPYAERQNQNTTTDPEKKS